MRTPFPKLLLSILLLFVLPLFVQAQAGKNAGGGLLKYIVYDFDGLDIGATTLPDGEYRNNDLQFSVAANPLAASDVIGDRVLKLDLNWQVGGGEFGKATMRFLELNPSADKLNFYIYNPSSNAEAASIQIIITEDDNDNNTYEDASDDKWTSTKTVPTGSGWQLVSVPLSSFSDGNTGGNGSFDAAYTGAGGMLFSVGLVFNKPSPSSGASVYYVDMICFSEGDLPVGASVLELPAQSSAGCALGALSSNEQPQLTPDNIHSLLPQGKKLSYVNWFMFYSANGSSPDMYPGNEVQQLIDKGFQPVITWEMMYAKYPRLDPVQPRLNKILDGTFDSYIDAVAAKIKSYSGTVIMRIFHEFEGDWYSWSLTENGKEPATYVAAYRRVVDRFRNAGAHNVRWMWCLNAEPKPYLRYNSVTKCYPGDNYVDIVATDIYNHPDLGTPDWKSFRYTMAETYYYLAKYYAHKPLFIAEAGCRERNSSEPAGSQSKADWLCMMDKDLRSYFQKAEALIFFSMQKEHDWRINSSEAAKQAFINCIWNHSYYGKPLNISENEAGIFFSAYPNPFSDRIHLTIAGVPDSGKTNEFRLYDVSGRVVFVSRHSTLPPLIHLPSLPAGIYVAEISSGNYVHRQKLLKSSAR